MFRTSRFACFPGALVVTVVSLSGCAIQSYRAAPIDAAAGAQRFEARTLDTPALKEYMVAHGHLASDWPVERWGLTELTLLAFYDHPDLEVARAQAQAVRAEAVAATQRAPFAVTPRVEHHSLRLEDQSSPWSLGFEVQIPLAAAAKGEAIRTRYDALIQAADLKVGAVAWEVRSRVRARLVDVYTNSAEIDLLQRVAHEREVMLTLLEQRLQAGAVSAVEVNSARLALVDAQSRLQTSRSVSAHSLGALAQALSLPLPLVRTLRLDYADLLQTAPITQDGETRRAALLNRLDIRGKLVEYAAAEADVRLEIARQYPTLAITPGFLWDQGDNIWSLAATIIPAVLDNRPAIAAAEARRGVEASQFRALQDRVIGEAQGAEAAYASLALALTQAEQTNVLLTTRARQTEGQFEAGYADRVELAAAHLEAIEAQRGALALRIEALRAQGILEDALQMPLTGGPLPQLGGTPSASITGLARQ